jgi:hypothetical protein
MIVGGGITTSAAFLLYPEIFVVSGGMIPVCKGRYCDE